MESAAEREKREKHELFCHEVSQSILNCREKVARLATLEVVKSRYDIGRKIVENELNHNRTTKEEYATLQSLSKLLTSTYGEDYSIDDLQEMRKFYLTYSSEKREEIQERLENRVHSTPVFPTLPLSWNHYTQLLNLTKDGAREFYEKEAIKGKWSSQFLYQQISNFLFERYIKLPNNYERKVLLKRVQKESWSETADQLIKDPYTLRFYNLNEDPKYHETKLESMIIERLSDLIQKKGDGLILEARQKKYTYKGQNYFVDLVFFNKHYKGYILVDVVHRPMSDDIVKAMQESVTFFDTFVKKVTEEKTVGYIFFIEDKQINIATSCISKPTLYLHQRFFPDLTACRTAILQWRKDWDYICNQKKMLEKQQGIKVEKPQNKDPMTPEELEIQKKTDEKIRHIFKYGMPPIEDPTMSQSAKQQAEKYGNFGIVSTPIKDPYDISQEEQEKIIQEIFKRGVRTPQEIEAAKARDRQREIEKENRENGLVPVTFEEAWAYWRETGELPQEDPYGKAYIPVKYAKVNVGFPEEQNEVPVFKEDFKNPEVFAQKVDKAERIFNIIYMYPGIKIKELSERTRIPIRTLGRFLKELKKTKRIEYIGSKKTGGWHRKLLYE
jgi:predicted nuclease of restriction endonuclease-like (RecB) superfamily